MNTHRNTEEMLEFHYSNDVAFSSTRFPCKPDIYVSRLCLPKSTAGLTKRSKVHPIRKLYKLTWICCVQIQASQWARPFIRGTFIYEDFMNLWQSNLKQYLQSERQHQGQLPSFAHRDPLETGFRSYPHRWSIRASSWTTASRFSQPHWNHQLSWAATRGSLWSNRGRLVEFCRVSCVEPLSNICPLFKQHKILSRKTSCHEERQEGELKYRSCEELKKIQFMIRKWKIAIDIFN